MDGKRFSQTDEMIVQEKHLQDYSDAHQRVELGKGVAGTRRFRVVKAASAALLAIAIGAAPLVACSSTSSAASQAASASVSTSSDASQASSSSQSSDISSGSAPSSSSGGADTQTFDYSGTYVGALTADGETVEFSGQTAEATEKDQNAALAQNGGLLAAFQATFSKSGDDTDADRCNFYGANSIVLAVGQGSKAVVEESTLNATSEGSNAIFATDSGTVLAYKDTVNTTSDNSRGLDATYGGTIVASDLTVFTKGAHCAAVATDRGGGNISVASSTLATEGSGSPVLYSTGNIEVDAIEGVASASQLVGMEGSNRVMISNSTLTSTQTGKTASDPIANGIIIYQSTSGDADTSTGETALFQAVDSKLSSAIESGSMFYLTNTKAKVVLSHVDLDFNSDAANLIVAAGNDSNNWGTSGKNGATVAFTGIEQQLKGNIEADSISTIDLFLLSGSTWQGASSVVANSAGTAVSDNISVSIDATSKWTVSADSTVTNLNLASGGALVDANGKAVKIVDADGNTLVDGASSVKVTVTGEFSTTVSKSSVNELESANVDRSDFDATFNTATTYGTNSSKQAEQESNAGE